MKNPIIEQREIRIIGNGWAGPKNQSLESDPRTKELRVRECALDGPPNIPTEVNFLLIDPQTVPLTVPAIV